MKGIFLLIFSIFLFAGCKEKQTESSQNWESISQNVKYQESEKAYSIKSGSFNYDFPKKDLPFEKAILLNASLVGYFAELNLEDKIIGISSPEYVYSAKIRRAVAAGKIQNVGKEQKYDVEKIIALSPDVIFTNHIASFGNMYSMIEKSGIQIVFLDEYLEQNPLEKSSYLLLFGKLFDVEKQAVNRYNTIVNHYNQLKKLAQTSENRPVVLANEMYGNQWFLPGGKTAFARFIKDANAMYVNADNLDSKAVPMSFEEVFTRSVNAQFWVNVGNHKQKKELLQINPNYSKMNVYQNGQLFTVSGREKEKSNDFFESGVVRADLVLKDYIKIFHPNLLPDYKLTYLKPLN